MKNTRNIAAIPKSYAKPEYYTRRTLLIKDRIKITNLIRSSFPEDVIPAQEAKQRLQAIYDKQFPYKNITAKSTDLKYWFKDFDYKTVRFVTSEGIDVKKACILVTDADASANPTTP